DARLRSAAYFGQPIEDMRDRWQVAEVAIAPVRKAKRDILVPGVVLEAQDVEEERALCVMVSIGCCPAAPSDGAQREVLGAKSARLHDRRWRAACAAAEQQRAIVGLADEGSGRFLAAGRAAGAPC